VGECGSEPVGHGRDPDLGLGEVDTDGPVRSSRHDDRKLAAKGGSRFAFCPGASDRKIFSTMEG
jgi:hypothetical protein